MATHSRTFDVHRNSGVKNGTHNLRACSNARVFEDLKARMTSSLNSENISPGVVIGVAKELHKLSNEPLDGIKVTVNEEEVTDITAEIVGPEGTPFEGCLLYTSPSPRD